MFSVVFSVLIKAYRVRRRLEGRKRGSGVMDGWRGGGHKGIDGVSWRGISMLSCVLHLSGAPWGLLMPLSAMQY